MRDDEIARGPSRPDVPAPGAAARESTLAEARERMRALRSRLEGSSGGSVALHETHISWVLLAGDDAFKLKKPVKLPFLDFSTLAARQHFCDEELRLNRRLAPSLYLEVLALREGPDGPRFGGEGTVVDAVLRMRRFPAQSLLSEHLFSGTLSNEHIDRLAGRIARFHHDAAVAGPHSDFASAGRIAQSTQRLAEGIDAWLCRSDAAGAQSWPALRTWLDAECRRLAPLREMRLRAGRVRECHGDLHLANTLVLGDDVTAFDCIEFDPALRWIDVMDDVAFLVMDLLAHGRASMAFRFLDRWLEASGDFDGLVALRFDMVSRALVRAQVAALAEAEGLRAGSTPDASDYLRLAVRLADAGDPRLAITHGLPGSGKSFVSQRLLEHAGAIRIRSDVERKRLFGLAAHESSAGRAPDIYGRDSTERTYERLHDAARVALGAGYPTIVDAAFLRQDERAHFATLANELGVPFAIIDCEAPPEVLRQRLRQREAAGGDASEAGVTVLDMLERTAEPLADDERRQALRAGASAASLAALGESWLALRATPAESGDAGSAKEGSAKSGAAQP